MSQQAGAASSLPWYRSKMRDYQETIRLEQTIFAMPLAYMAMFLASRGFPTFHNFFWITLAFIGARFAGMSINKLADADLDKRIPRNARRALPSGRMKKIEVLLFIGVCFGVFIFSAYQLGPWPSRLWPVCVLALILSPYAKRFTAYSNFSIGMVYLLIPSSVWVAITQQFGWPPVLLGIAAALWNTGFDTIYRCQDAKVDPTIGLHSLAADYGVATALRLAQLMHVGTTLCLFIVGLILDVGVWYYVGLTIAAGLFIYQHSLVKPNDLSKLNKAFFQATSMISIVLFAFVVIDTAARA
ncbi:MAG: 4-hydroxybenzoate octaprenyltransferase [Dehalococcoidia bacterium]|nr:4-hydroxybenzoate octaprenyltransferase [Dehalococcoidia bacterium]